MAKKDIKEHALVVQDGQLVSLTEIQARIYMVRGVQVMLDRDLAVFYKVETGQLNRQVKRNIGRFPEDFMFQLSKEEWEALKCQFGISNLYYEFQIRWMTPLPMLVSRSNWCKEATLSFSSRKTCC